MEIQTRCRISLTIEPEWNGKIWQHLSRGKVCPVPDSQHAEEASGETAATSLSTTPQKRHRPLATPRVERASSSNQMACRICGSTEEDSFWLGCGHTNPRTKRQDCQYWVHQNCIDLYYKHAQQLSKVPYYCPVHGPKE